jgi:hypothetical protein
MRNEGERTWVSCRNSKGVVARSGVRINNQRRETSRTPITSGASTIM